MRRVYLSGGISHNPNYKQQFKCAEDLFTLYYEYKVFNPAKVSLKTPPFPTWSDFMKFDIPYLCQSDLVYMLKGWWKSRGARIEWVLAKILKIEIWYE